MASEKWTFGTIDLAPEMTFTFYMEQDTAIIINPPETTGLKHPTAHHLRNQDDLARNKAVWESGNFGLVARSNEPAALDFTSRLAIRPGDRVLDVACGTGNLAVLAARRGCVTSGVDIASNLIAQAKARAAADRLLIDFVEGDAESLPYPDATFDFVVSMYGVMFAPHPERAVSELLRVCRSGGTIALANWTPEGMLGETFRVVGRHIPLPEHIAPPLLWGDEAIIRQRLGHHVSGIRLTRRIARLRYPYTIEGTVDFFRKYYGPTVRAFAALNFERQRALQADLVNLFCIYNRDLNGSTEFHAEYLEVVATRN